MEGAERTETIHNRDAEESGFQGAPCGLGATCDLNALES
jgi:hypothetical protein